MTVETVTLSAPLREQQEVLEQSSSISPNSSASQSSVGGISESSSKASNGYTSANSSITTATSTSLIKSRSKAPTLDAIAARMKKNMLADTQQQGVNCENSQTFIGGEG